MAELHPVTQYAVDVLAGKYVVGKSVRLGCQRHLADLERAKEPGFAFQFSEEAANHALEFLKFCRHGKGEWAGEQIEAQPWQVFVVGSLFGWIRKSDGMRRFRIGLIECGRKNGKTLLAAVIALLLFFADGEFGACVYFLATKRDQARLGFDDTVQMVRASPELKKRISIFRNSLVCEETNSKLEPLSSDENTLDGLNVSGGVIDEFHAHKTAALFHLIDTATSSRRQPLLCVISTAGNDKHSPFGEFHAYAEKNLSGAEGIEDNTVFSYIASLDDEDDVFDEDNWPKANPNLNVSVKLDDLRRKAAKAKEMPSARAAFEQLHCNRWVEGFDKWLLPETWARCGADLRVEDFEGRTCYAGLDLSTTTDLTAFVLCFPDDEGIAVFPWCWIPAETAAKKERSDRVPYRQWARGGFIEMTEGDAVDYDVLFTRIIELHQRFDIRCIGADRWNASQLINQLQGAGLNVMGVGQGFRDLSDPTKQTERRILSGELRHPKHPVLDFCFSNVVLERDAAGNIKPSKKKSTQRIDLAVATIMSVGIASVNATSNEPKLIFI